MNRVAKKLTKIADANELCNKLNQLGFNFKVKQSSLQATYQINFEYIPQFNDIRDKKIDLIISKLKAELAIILINADDPRSLPNENCNFGITKNITFFLGAERIYSTTNTFESNTFKLEQLEDSLTLDYDVNKIQSILIEYLLENDTINKFDAQNLKNTTFIKDIDQ